MSLLKRILRKIGLMAPEARPAPSPSHAKPAKKAEPAADKPTPAEEPAAEEALEAAPAEEAKPAAKPAADKSAANKPTAKKSSDKPAALTAADVEGKDVLVAWLDRLATELGTLAKLADVPEDRLSSFAKGQEGDDADKRVRSARHWTPRLRTPLKKAKDGTPKAVARGLISDAHSTYSALVTSFETGDHQAEAVAQLGNLIPHVAGTVAAWGDKPAEAKASDEVLAELRATVGA